MPIGQQLLDECLFKISGTFSKNASLFNLCHTVKKKFRLARGEPHVAHCNPCVAHKEPHVAHSEPHMAHKEPHMDQYDPHVALCEPHTAQNWTKSTIKK